MTLIVVNTYVKSQKLPFPRPSPIQCQRSQSDPTDHLSINYGRLEKKLKINENTR